MSAGGRLCELLADVVIEEDALLYLDVVDLVTCMTTVHLLPRLRRYITLTEIQTPTMYK